MKKLMVSTIILLPLIILAIMLVSGAILSLAVHIFVESVEFVESDPLVLVLSDESAPPSEALEINVLPLNAENRGLRFEVEDESVATVDEKGVLTAKYFGETYVTVYSVENNAAKASRKVTVTDNAVHKLVIDGFSDDMYKGETQKLLVRVLPAEALNKQVTFASSDTSVLSVTDSGDVTCNAAGEATVTATSVERPEVQTSVTIKCHAPLEGLSVEVQNVTTALTTAKFPKLTATPQNATYSVQYTSSNDNIAQVDEQGDITIHNAGNVDITARAYDERGHVYSKTVTYHCTCGYYLGSESLLQKDRFEYDYDAQKGKTLDDIVLRSSLEGSYRQITSVEFSKEGLIEFDESTKKFKLLEVDDSKELGEVKVTIHANKYNAATGKLQAYQDDVFFVTVRRNVSSLTFKRGEDSISGTTIKERSVGLSVIKSGVAASGIGVLVAPANTTNTIEFSLKEGGEFAHIDGATLNFDREGRAVVTVTAKDADGHETLSKDVSVTYSAPTDTDKLIELNSDTQQQLNVALDINDNGTKESGLLQVQTPEGMTYVCESQNEDVVKVSEDGLRLLPQKGGFATVTVKFVPISEQAAGIATTADEGKTFAIKIYVDKAVVASDLKFDISDGFVTSKESVAFTLTVDNSDGKMEGKQLYADGALLEGKAQDGDMVYTSSREFAGADRVQIVASVKYAQAAKELVEEPEKEICQNSVNASTTHGKLLSAPALTLGGIAVDEGNDVIAFDDIVESGEQPSLELVVDARDPQPSDLVLSMENFAFTNTTNFDWSITEIEGNVAKIKLTPKVPTLSGDADTTLTVAGQSVALKVRVATKAHKLEVKYGQTALASEGEYRTMLPSLTFAVAASRGDNIDITDKSIEYSTDDDKWNIAADGQITLDMAALFATGETVAFAVKSGTAEFALALSKLELGALNFNYQIEFNNNGQTVQYPFECDNSLEAEEYSFPQAMNNVFDVCVRLEEMPEDVLGGLYEEAVKAYFSVEFGESNRSWKVQTNSLADNVTKLTVTVPEEYEYFFIGEPLKFKAGEDFKNFTLNHTGVVKIGFAGFDSAVYNDVHKGYQQVRVFAKHSYIGGKQVDYIRMPLSAVNDIVTQSAADLDSVSWTLTSYTGDAADGKFVITQRGKNIAANGKAYELVQEGESFVLKLKNADGTSTDIAKDGKYLVEGEQRVPFVDVYSEAGYAHVYFGAVNGLRESDVQNDYFGNFDDDANYMQPSEATDDNSGRDFKTYDDSSFKFLRVEAGDGIATSDVKAHFNFNVLQDEAVVNVYNATGYYAYDKVVLHENLYGPGELQEDDPNASKAEENDLILTKTNESGEKPWQSSDSNVLGKNVIYGNGYQVNFEAKNKQLTDHQDTGTSHGVYVKKAINADVKASNTKTSINKSNQVVVMIMEYGYYCTIENYSKMSPWGAGAPSNAGRVYLKNTVLRNASQSALQLYYGASTAYIENVVQNECVGGFTADSKDYEYHVVFNFKGFVDVLNYMSYLQLGNSIGTGAFLMDMYGFTPYLTKCDNYLEWLGRTPDKLTPSLYGDPESWWGTRFANVFLYNRILPSQNSTLTLNYWDENSNSYKASDNGVLGNGVKVAAAIDALVQGLNYKICVYDAEVNSDGGIIGDNSEYADRNMNELFSDARYIRVLCQYASLNGKGYSATPVKNYDHILWHTQRVYRDLSLIDGGEQTHIENLKESLLGKGIKWPDGTTPEDAFDAEAAAIAKAAQGLLATALPERKKCVEL